MNEKTPAIPSARIMTHLRLYLSATTPPRGDKSAVGKRAAIPPAASMAAEVVIYHKAAKVAAQVAKIEAACPLQIRAIVCFQVAGRGWLLAFNTHSCVDDSVVMVIPLHT